MTTTAPDRPSADPSFAEPAMRLGGRREGGPKRTRAIGQADAERETLFEKRRQTTASPVHRAVWDRGFPAELFDSAEEKTPADVQQVMDASIAVVHRHRNAGTLLDENGKTRESVLQE